MTAMAAMIWDKVYAALVGLGSLCTSTSTST